LVQEATNATPRRTLPLTRPGLLAGL
jgi:hypothetical protein